MSSITKKLSGLDETKSTLLCEIMGRNKSDKGNLDITKSWHNYTTVYDILFKDFKDKEISLFELGLGSINPNMPYNMGANGRPGASLYSWAEYFPKAKIYAADIDKNTLFNTERIETFFCDQKNKIRIKMMWKKINKDFDIIVEDGLHEIYANVIFFENSIHKIKIGGYFIIEDIAKPKEMSFHISRWKNNYLNFDIELINIPSSVNNYDNNMVIAYRKY